MVGQTALRTFVVDGDGNRNVFYLDQSDGRWYVNYNWLDNDFNRNERVASSSNWQHLARDLPHPTAQHAADFSQFLRKRGIFLIIERFYLPENL